MVAQVDATQIRTGGTNYIHVSEIDRFVEATPQMLSPEEQAEILSRTPPDVRALVEPEIPRIADFRRRWIVSMFPNFTLDIAKMMLNRMVLGEPPIDIRQQLGDQRR